MHILYSMFLYYLCYNLLFMLWLDDIFFHFLQVYTNLINFYIFLHLFVIILCIGLFILAICNMFLVFSFNFLRVLIYVLIVFKFYCYIWLSSFVNCSRWMVCCYFIYIFYYMVKYSFYFLSLKTYSQLSLKYISSSFHLLFILYWYCYM